MFVLNVDKEEFALKPMNCPGHCVIFDSRDRSYKELPLRMAEFGVVHRNEASGALSGLTRVRRFVQDDTHIFCMPNQVPLLYSAFRRWTDSSMRRLKLKSRVYSTSLRRFMVSLGSLSSSASQQDRITISVNWRLGKKLSVSVSRTLLKSQRELNSVTQQLTAVLDRTYAGKWELNPGDGAFYGPKIDITIKDALGRSFQCATIQLDFQLPEQFKLKYRGPEAHDDPELVTRPVMIHRAILGSLERFIGILTEHTAGKW